MSMFQYTLALRKWQLLALIVLALLTVVAISCFMLYTVGHIDHQQVFMYLANGPNNNPNIENGHP